MFQYRGSHIFSWILAVHVFISKVCFSSSMKCYASQPTLTTVQSCPLTQKEIKEATRRKNCESLALSQNCTKPENFKYHCVLSMDRRTLVEVCAPQIFSQGYCVGFDTLGFQIQQIFKSSCTRFQEPCPIGFASWNSTAFSGCYKLKVNQQLKSDNVKSHKNATWISVSAFVAFVSGLLLTVLVQKLYGILKDYKEKKRKNNHLQENQNETDTFPPFLSDTGEETDISWTAYNTTGFDKESFDKVIKDFHLTSVEDLFKQNHIDCVATFLRLDSDKLQQLGLDIGQQEKCKNAIERISHAANKRQSHQKGNSLTNMSISETSESREPSVRSIPLATKKRINILLKEHTFIPRKTF